MQKFNNTSEIEPLKDFLGQDRAMTAMEFGLKIDNPSYNIYVAGEPGTGKTTYTMKVLETYANNKENHKDWCYVYNFDNPREPIVISLQRGEGKVFNWSNIGDIPKGLKVFIAGGISEENVIEAMAFKAIHGIDVSSSVESIINDKRIKDEKKVERLIRKVRENNER